MLLIPSDVSTAAVLTRRRTKLQSPEDNVSIFKLPYKTIKSLKTATNSSITDTNFNVRRHFTATLSSNNDATITVEQTKHLLHQQVMTLQFQL